MYTAIARIVCKGLLKRNIIAKSELEEHQFGIKYTVAIIANTITVLLTGFILSVPAEAAIFLVGFAVLRPYAGGFHFQNHGVCFLSSIVTTVAILKGNLLLSEAAPHVSIAAACLGASLILWLAPVAASRKPLDALERKVFRRRCIAALMVELAVSSCFSILECRTLASVLNLTILLVGCCVAAGKIQKRIVS